MARPRGTATKPFLELERDFAPSLFSPIALGLLSTKGLHSDVARWLRWGRKMADELDPLAR